MVAPDQHEHLDDHGVDGCFPKGIALAVFVCDLLEQFPFFLVDVRTEFPGDQARLCDDREDAGKALEVAHQCEIKKEDDARPGRRRVELMQLPRRDDEDIAFFQGILCLIHCYGVGVLQRHDDFRSRMPVDRIILILAVDMQADGRVVGEIDLLKNAV